MDLGLSEEQELLKNNARDFLEKECPESLVREMEDDEKGYSPDLWKKMAEQGWQGLLVPENFGGAGFGYLDLIVRLEEFGRALVPGPFISTVVGGALPLMEAGTDDQKSQYLPQIASGNAIWTLAYTEPSARFDAEGIATEAKEDGGDVVLNGTKLFIRDANVADFFTVVARKPGSKGEDGISLVIVPAKTAGVTINMLKTIAADKQAEVKLENVKVPKANVIPGGFATLKKVKRKATVIECA
jgi:alkylation response protein AidB-like acyl-CoA dehydrogenase